MDLIVLLLAASATALATGLGAVPVFLLGERAERYRPGLWGLAIGVMGVASVVGLLEPALEDGSAAAVGGGLVAGVAFLLAAQRLLGARRRDPVIPRMLGSRTALLVFVVLLVHSLPEGFAIGTAYASTRSGLSLFVILAIGLQNVPEGTSVAIPMAASGSPASRQFWAAAATSAPQPVGALVAYGLVETIRGLLPVSFAFAAGAMLSLLAIELIPAAFRHATWGQATVGTAAGAALMLALSALLGV